MKLIEALKQIQDLQRKAEDLRGKVGEHSAHLNVESPVYPDQRKKIDGWLKAHSDIIAEILRLRVAIQKTNLETVVAIEIGGKKIEKSIAEWIHRRRDLANLEYLAWKKLTDRNLKEGIFKESTGAEREVKIVRYYDPEEKDRKLDEYQSEPMIIDSRLEVINAVTDLIE